MVSTVLHGLKTMVGIYRMIHCKDYGILISTVACDVPAAMWRIT